MDSCLARPGSIARPPAATQVAVFLRRQQGKTEGKTGCAERDELSDGWLRESDFPVRDGSGAGATTGRGPQARRLMVRNGNAKPAPDVLTGAVQRRGRTSGAQPLGQIIREEEFPYNPALFENAPRKCSLVGYWQCEKYFFGLRDELRERLLPREPLPARSIATERAILDAGERSVFVHVRRTDYVGNPYHVVLPMDYYREAAALIAAKVPDPVFFIFSDDPEWCEANFKLPYHTTIAGNFDRTVEHHLGREDADLYLMRLCGHAIMANSSYSWWGAWLGADIKGGMVIAPKAGLDRRAKVRLARYRSKSMDKTVKGAFRALLWHPLLNLTRPIRHSLGWRKECPSHG